MEQPKYAVYRYRWVILISVWLAYVVFWIQRLSIPPLAPFLREELQLTHAEIGLLMSAAAAGVLAIQLPAGWLIDRIGIRIPLLIGQVLGGISLLGMSRIHSVNSGIAIMALVGIWVGFLTVSTTKAVVHWFPAKERATVMGLKQTGLNLGGILMAAILPTLALTSGWRVCFLIVGGLAISFGIITFILYREFPKSRTPPIPVPADPTITVRAPARSSVREIFLNRDLLLLSISCLFISFVEFAAVTHLVVYLNTVALLPVVTSGFLLAVCEGGGTLGKPLSGLVSDRLFGSQRKRPFILMNTITCACCLLVLSFAATAPLWGLVIIFAVFGLTAIGWGGLYLTLVGEFAGTERAGLGTGFSVIITGFGPLLGPTLFGYIVDLSGSYQLAWLFLAICAALSVLLLFFIREERRKL